jgi:hypothetical protein
MRIAVFRKKASFRIEDAVEFNEIATCLPVLHGDRDYELLKRVSALATRTIEQKGSSRP